jgi:hypothetical protein
MKDTLMGYLIKLSNQFLEGYTDADWNTLSNDSKATGGYIFSIAGGVVS